MTRAADPVDMTRAPAILAAPPPFVPVRDGDAASTSAWDNEGGHLARAGTPRATADLSTIRSR
jgi:hypothetical protein